MKIARRILVYLILKYAPSGNSMKIEVLYEKTQRVLLNGEELNSEFGSYNFSYGNNLIPGIGMTFNDDNVFISNIGLLESFEDDHPIWKMFYNHNKNRKIINLKIYEKLKKYFSPNTSKNNVLNLINNIPLGSNASVLKSLKKIFIQIQNIYKKIKTLQTMMEKIFSFLC